MNAKPFREVGKHNKTDKSSVMYDIMCKSKAITGTKYLVNFISGQDQTFLSCHSLHFL